MAELSISNATYGRDTKGQTSLYNNLKGDIDKIYKGLTSDATYATFMNKIDGNWSGTDADQFKKSFKSSIAEIKKQIKAYETNISNLLEKDAKNFAKSQSANASTITSTVSHIN